MVGVLNGKNMIEIFFFFLSTSDSKYIHIFWESKGENGVNFFLSPSSMHFQMEKPFYSEMQVFYKKMEGS